METADLARSTGVIAPLVADDSLEHATYRMETLVALLLRLSSRSTCTASKNPVRNRYGEPL